MDIDYRELLAVYTSADEVDEMLHGKIKGVVLDAAITCEHETGNWQKTHKLIQFANSPIISDPPEFNILTFEGSMNIHDPIPTSRMQQIEQTLYFAALNYPDILFRLCELTSGNVTTTPEQFNEMRASLTCSILTWLDILTSQPPPEGYPPYDFARMDPQRNETLIECATRLELGKVVERLQQILEDFPGRFKI